MMRSNESQSKWGNDTTSEDEQRGIEWQFDKNNPHERRWRVKGGKWMYFTRVRQGDLNDE